MVKQFSDTEKLLLLLAALAGSLILLFPVQHLIVALLLLVAFVYLVLKPHVAFCLVLALSSYVPAFSTGLQQMPFNQTDVLVGICFLGLFLRIVFVDKFKVNLKTKIDTWMVILLVMYFFMGITSLSHRGYQGFLQFGEVFVFYYMTVYFLRTKTLKLSTIIKVVLFAGLFQACYGILQSITGSFGADFQSA
ncbi:hypothetical protein tpqmel_0349, partial [Candidatus Gastranaerophilus sp. (ex Termes propinquus)]